MKKKEERRITASVHFVVERARPISSYRRWEAECLRRLLHHRYIVILDISSFSEPRGTRSNFDGSVNCADMYTIGQEQHHAIIEAIENRHGTRAEAIGREHARLSRRNLESVLTDSEILSCVPGNSLIKT